MNSSGEMIRLFKAVFPANAPNDFASRDWWAERTVISCWIPSDRRYGSNCSDIIVLPPRSDCNVPMVWPFFCD